MKICALTVMPSPYMKDFFGAMHADPEFDLHVLYQELAAPDTHWNRLALPDYAQLLPGRWIPFLGGRLHWNPSVVCEMEHSDAELYIVQGYAGFTSQKAMKWLNRTGRPWIFWGELPGMTRRGRLATKLRERAMQPLRQSRGIAAIGSQAVDAYRNFTGGRIPVANIPYVCETAPFQAAAKLPRKAGEVTILFCGQLIERKGVRELLHAYRRAQSSFAGLRLILVGTGPLEESLIAGLSPDERDTIEFTGFQPIDRLPAQFARADLFVLPSHHDGWGVVMNQALAAGLPLVASDRVGATDLIRPGWNGETFKAGDAAALAGILTKLTTDEKRRNEYAYNSTSLAAEWTLAAGVERWKDLIRQIELTHPQNRPQVATVNRV